MPGELSAVIRALHAAMLRGPVDGAALAALSSALAAVPLSELGDCAGVSAAARAGAGAIRCTDVAAAPWATVSLFQLGRGAELPAHDHPGLVLARVLRGALRVVSLSPEAEAAAAAPLPRARARALGDFGGAWRLTRNEVVRAADGAGAVLITQAHRDCVHALRQEGEEAAVLLDIIAPPYPASDDLDDVIYCGLRGGGDLFALPVGARCELQSVPATVSMTGFGYRGPPLVLPP